LSVATKKNGGLSSMPFSLIELRCWLCRLKLTMHARISLAVIVV
jgi:hypothetical protein